MYFFANLPSAALSLPPKPAATNATANNASTTAHRPAHF